MSNGRYDGMVRSSRLRVDVDSPIPRPRPREELRCDESKEYASDQVCFPLEANSNMDFTLDQIFGRSIRGVCPVAANLDGHVHIGMKSPSMDVSPPPNISNGYAHYTLQGRDPFPGTTDPDEPFSALVTFNSEDLLPSPPPPALTVSRWLTGHGQERGGLQVLFTNPSPSPLDIIYLESLPWFMKAYLHTLRASRDSRPIDLSSIRYRPAIDRLRGTQLEVALTIPSEATVSLTWDFDKSILRYTEYPPDANRGFDIAYTPHVRPS
jgi:GPI-anchor transamidase subunit T